MPNKDPTKYEYVRVRTRKEKDKDRDKDSRSVAESSTGSTTTIRERKHRNSVLAGHGSSHESSSQAPVAAYQDVSLDQLPPLPDTECSDNASTTTSPIMRTNSLRSNPTTQKSPKTFDTPAKLQPYLESEPDTSSIAPAEKLPSEPKEWIGPRVDVHSYLDDSETPRPEPKRDPLASVGRTLSPDKIDKDRQKGSSPGPEASQDNQGRLISDTNAMVYAWAGSDSGQEQYYDASELANPFLPFEHTSASQKKTPPLPETRAAQPAQPRPQLHRSPPPPRSSAPSQERVELRPPSNLVYGPPARIEPPQMSHSPPMMDMNVPPGYNWSMVPAPSPAPMQHAISSPLPYPNIHPPLPPPTIDHPAHILHRIGSVLPDIGALMDMYQSTCSILVARDSQINDLQMQKAAEAEHQNHRIDKLTCEIESLLERHASKVKHMKNDIAYWEERHEKVEQNHTKEKKLREESRTAHTQLKAKFEEEKQTHQETVESMKHNHKLEKERMTIVHSEERRQLQEQMRLAARDAERDMQSHETWWQKRLREVEEHNQQALREMEDELRTKERILEEERRNYCQAKKGWDAEHISLTKKIEEERHNLSMDKVTWEKDRTSMTRQSNEERDTLTQNAEHARDVLKAEHRKENDDMQKRLEDRQAQQSAEAQEEIFRLKGDNQNLQGLLDRTNAHLTSEIQNATANFVREKEDYAKATESSFSRQQAELQETIRKLQREKAELLRTRCVSQTRQAKDPSESSSRPEKEQEDLSRVSSAEKSKAYKPSLAEGVSRSSTPAPKEERNRIHRASGIYGSGTSLKSKSLSPEQQSKASEPPRRSEDGRSGAKEQHH